MITNSRSDSSVTAGGSSQVEASPIAAVGDIDGGGQNFVGDTVLKPHTVPQLDPLAHIPDPPTQTSCESKLSATMGPGCYGSMDINGHVTLAPTSEERRVGNKCVAPCSYRVQQVHENKTTRQ